MDEADGDRARSGARARQRLVDRQLRGRDIVDPRVLAAMGSVERERFVPPEARRHAYEDRALPIGHGQTISQPYMVALSLQLLELGADERLLEVGAGSGYAAAVAARLVREVVAVERVAPLAAGAARALQEAGVANVRIVAADGARGTVDGGPWDAILVSAAAARLPLALYAELAPAGRLVVPIGPPQQQRLNLVRRGAGGEPEVVAGPSCRFVPLIGG